MGKKYGTHEDISERVKNWWIKLKASELDRKIKELLWKTFHCALPLGEKLKIWFNEDGLCTLCKSTEETYSHLFKNCPVTNDFLIWTCNALHIPLGELLEEDVNTNFHTSLNNKSFYALAICRKVIWYIRNSVKYDGLTVNLHSFKINFRLMLKCN